MTGLTSRANALRPAPPAIAGPRGVANGEVEVKNRKTGACDIMTIDAAINRFTGN